MSQIKLLIVEDDKDWLRGLVDFLSREPDIKVISQAQTCDEALELLKNEEFDVILMDISLAGETEGIWLTSEVCKMCSARVIMLTSHKEKDIIFDAFRAGATDYLAKSDFEKIPDTIRSAFKKESPISASVAEQIREEFRRLKQLEQQNQVKEIRDMLTSTELKIMEMISEGVTQRSIAKQMVVSLRTIKVHVGNALKKLGEKSSKNAAKKLRDMGVFKEESM
ncbi:response regulator transcription factor [Fictibacillus sp. Mic-4]|uniref:response regulator transcription factor n=1 Tax=Fictibacillus TaxID=1329200 RepID=UPI0004201181|nr:response regulator transcription factor [Fictibacillus gelatini]